MPQNAQITINDGKSTPVAHIFSPQRIDPATGIATWNERNTDTMVGNPALSFSMRPDNGKLRTSKGEIKLTLPKVALETINGVTSTKVLDTAIGKIELVIPTNTTAQERKDLRVMLSNALLNATFAQAFDNVENFW